MRSTPLSISLLLSCALLVKAAFVFEFEILSHSTNGDCFGIDFTIPCETFVTDFCLRGPSYVGARNTNNHDCPLGKNTNRVFTVIPQTRTIESVSPWPGVFQLYIRAYDDDHPLQTADHLDNIFLDTSRTVGDLYSTAEMVWGANNKVGVNIRYKVTCQPNYYRYDCFEFCVAQDDDSSGHYTCNPFDGSKICNEGYEHPETNCIDRVTACSSSPCEQQALCTPIGLTDFSCSCPPGYTSKRCEIEVDECDSSPCQHEGNCTDFLADYSCSCLPGYTGRDCELDIDECLEVDCVGNATCVDGVNGYTCVCNHGFEGPNCTEINPCDSSPCATTGTCEPMGPFQYSCTCDTGYTGLLCDTDIDDCVSADCPANSECVDGVDSYSCVCHDGFESENCTLIATVTEGAASNQGALIGAVVGSLMALIALTLIIILIVVIVIIMARRERSKRQYTVPENPYEVRPSNEPDFFVQSADPLINNPLYTSNSISSSEQSPVPQNGHIPNIQNQDIYNMSTSPAYNSTLRDVNNPLYGSDTMSPVHRNPGPIYSEPVRGDSTLPQKGSVSYPYSYAVVDRASTSKSTMKAPPPNYEVAILESKPAPHGGPQYEDIDLKPEPSEATMNGTQGYDVPKPVGSAQSTASQPPLVYHYATGETTAKATTAQKPPKLGEAVAKAKEGPPKRSIYDSQDESTEIKPSKPVPPPRTKPVVPKKPDVYSYATSESAKRSIKVKELTDADQLPTNAPYNKLEHDLGPDVPANQVRLAKVEGSGYQALQSE